VGDGVKAGGDVWEATRYAALPSRAGCGAVWVEDGAGAAVRECSTRRGSGWNRINARVAVSSTRTANDDRTASTHAARLRSPATNARDPGLSSDARGCSSTSPDAEPRDEQCATRGSVALSRTATRAGWTKHSANATSTDAADANAADATCSDSTESSHVEPRFLAECGFSSASPNGSSNGPVSSNSCSAKAWFDPPSAHGSSPASFRYRSAK